MKFLKKTSAAIIGLAMTVFALGGCTTQFDGDVEGEYKADGTTTEIAVNCAASKCSGWSEFYAYVYVDGGATDVLGNWPGTKMEESAGEKGIYALKLPALGDGLTYKLIYHNNSGSQFDVGSFKKGDSKIFDAQGNWTSWHWGSTSGEGNSESGNSSGTNPSDGQDNSGSGSGSDGNGSNGGNSGGENQGNSGENGSGDVSQITVLPNYLRGGEGIGGDSKQLTYSISNNEKIAVYEWTAQASGWGAGDGNIAFKLTEFGDWNQHEGSTAAGGVTWSGSSYRTTVAVNADFTELTKCTTDEAAGAADNIIGTGFTVGNQYRLTVKVSADGKVRIKIESIS